MKFGFIRIMAVIALGIALIVPQKASAQALNADQTNAVASTATIYFEHLLSLNGNAFDPNALVGVVTKSFSIIGTNGKPLNLKNLADRLAKLSLSQNQYDGRVSVDSSSVSGKTITANVTVKTWAKTFTDDTNFPIAGQSSHILTLVQIPTGKWLIQKDVITKAQVQH